MILSELAAKIPAHKLFAPPAYPGAILRERILSSIFSHGAPSSVVIQGPAGHGKSTLLQQIKSRSERSGMLTGWLSLEESDNDPTRFLAALQALIKSVAPSSESRRPDAPASRNSRGRLLPADWLLDWLADMRQPVALFFDEFQVLTNRGAIAFFRTLLEHLPAPHRVFIGSRTVPNIGLARLVVNNQALLMRAEDLRFSRDEVASFFAGASELKLSERELKSIYDNTEGWPAALQLYRLSLTQPAVRESLDDLSLYRPRQLAEYLTDNVLSLQPEQIQDFLLMTSPLLRLSGSLCDTVLDQGNSQEILVGLEKSGLFLRSLDAGMEWFSYHTLFSSFLVELLQERKPEAARQIHQRAASWFQEHGYFEEAMHHALATGDFALSANCLDTWAAQLVMDGNLTTVEYWYDRLPLDEIAERPELVIKVAWSLAFLRRRRKLAPILKLLEDQRAVTAPDQEAPEDVVRSMVAIIDDDFVEAHRIVNPVDAQDTNARGFRAFELGAAANLKGYLELNNGNFELAREYLVLARAHGDRANSGFSWGYSIGTAGFNFLCQGQLREALELVEANISQPRLMLDDSVASAALVACHIQLLYDINDLDGARNQFQRFHEVIANGALHDYLISAYVAMSRIHDADGYPEKALQVLEEAESIAHMSDWPRLLRRIGCERVRRAIVSGDLDSARSIASRVPKIEVELPDSWIPFSECTDDDRIGEIRLAIYDDQINKAMAALQTEIARARNQKRVRRRIRLHILEAIGNELGGRLAGAAAAMREALSLAFPGGFLRMFLDEGPVAIDLIHAEHQRCQRAGAASDTFAGFVARLVEIAGDDHAKSQILTGEEFQPLEALSAREEATLKLLAKGLSNREIANTIHVSENTVKFHLKNVYSKLGVKNRLQAINAARKLRLL